MKDFMTEMMNQEAGIWFTLREAHHTGNWDRAVEKLKAQLKAYYDLMGETNEHWEGFNEPDLK
jgi:hypothetical protein